MDFIRKPDETSFDYIKRMVRAKIDGVFTGTYSEWIKLVFGKEHSEDVSRREYYGCKMFIASVEDEDSPDNASADILEDLKRREFDIDKKRLKLADELSYINRLKRDIARGETIGEYAAAAANIIKEHTPFFGASNINASGSSKAVLCLSDWHYGLEANGVVNIFNPAIAKDRLQQLLNNVLLDIDKFDIDEIVVANLGDLISGIIHTTIRIENRVDVITQTIEVSEMLAEVLNELGKHVKVRYYSVIDNHGRVFANKNESMDKENFNRMIDFYLAERFKDNENVEILQNNIDETIMHFALYNWTFVGVHGHDDNPSTAVNDLSNFMHIDYNVCLLGHRHSPALSESCGDLTISNGCLCGTDVYAKKRRLSSRPSQNLVIVTPENPCAFLHTIVLQ